MRKAFTLLELIATMAIIAVLGASAVGGYHAMQRAMEERGVMLNVNAAFRAAYQRAQIDRQPVVVYCWNETSSVQSDDSQLVAHGHLVAVRRAGRFSDVKGQLLYDEFEDLDVRYPPLDENATTTDQLIYLYAVDDVASDKVRKSSIYYGYVMKPLSVVLLSDSPSGVNAAGNSDPREVPACAFKIKERNGVSWQRGMAYGFEFLSFDLPNGFLFGKDYSDTLSTPVKGEMAFVFDVENAARGGGSSGKDTVQIYNLRQQGEGFKPVLVGTTDSPRKDLK